MGFNPYGLRTAKALWQDVGLDAEKIAGNYQFATTQNFHMLETPDRRHIIHRADLAEFQQESRSAARRRGESAARTHALSRSGSTKATPGAWRST